MAKFLLVLIFGLFYPTLSDAQQAEQTPKVTSFPAPKDGNLTVEMLNFYEENGFLVLTGFKSPRKTKQIRAKAIKLAKKYNKVGGIHTSVTDEDDIEEQERYFKYFFESANQIRAFYEPDGVDMEEGIILNSPHNSMNKLGHAVHKDLYFKKLSTKTKFKNLAKSLDIKKPTIVQSMLIFKPPGVGGAVSPHQDAAFLYTEPQSVINFWLALEKADKENACLCVIPGGHKGELFGRIVLDEDKTATEIIDQKDIKDLGWTDDKFLPLEVDPGTLIILHGKIPHKSKKNDSIRSRNAYTFQVISDEAEYSDRNWLQKPAKLPLY